MVVCRNIYVPALDGIHSATPSPFPETKDAPFTVTETSASASADHSPLQTIGSDSRASSATPFPARVSRNVCIESDFATSSKFSAGSRSGIAVKLRGQPSATQNAFTDVTIAGLMANGPV